MFRRECQRVERSSEAECDSVAERRLNPYIGAREPSYDGLNDPWGQTWYFDPQSSGKKYFPVHRSVHSQRNH